MKLKNSCILLIAIALFLLVSIGSVCASENATNELAAQIDASGSDVIAIDNMNDNSIISEGETGDVQDNGTEPEKINTTVTSNDVEASENDPVEIPVAVKDNESNNIVIGKENITVAENNKAINFNYNNSIISIADKLPVGNHSLIISYLGNDIYKNSTTSIILSIFGNKTIDAPSSVTTNEGMVAIPLILSDGVKEYDVDLTKLTLNLTYVNETGNETSQPILSAYLENNTVNFSIGDLKFITAFVNVSYTDGATSSKKVAIKLPTNVTAQNAKFNEKDNKTIPVSVLSGDNVINVTKDNLKVVENDKDIAFEYNNSEITITTLTPGNHTLTIKYLGNDTFAESSKDILVSVYGNIIINTNSSSINVNSTKKGQVVINNITNSVDIIDFNLDDLSVTASYKVGNDTFIAKVNAVKLENKTLFIEFEDLNFTTATLTITYNNTASANVTVNRIYNAKITVVNGKNQYENGAFTFKLTDVDTNTVISGKTVSLYTVGNIRAGFSATTDAKGVASFYTKNLYEFDNTNGSFTMRQFEVGKHKVELSTSGDVKTTTVKTNLTVTKAEIKIVIANFKEIYGTDKNVTITVTNKNDGSAVPGIILRLDMPQTSGKTYYFQTDSNGQSKISVKQLVSGTYSITVQNNDTKNMKAAKATKNIVITPLPAVIHAKNVVRYYNTGKTATIKVTDKKGKALSGIYVTVQLYTGKKSKTYLFQTNKKGAFTFSASLDVGKHKMVIKTADTRYKASTVTKYITVKKTSAKFKAPKVVSYYKGGKYFTITLLNPKNLPIYDAKVNVSGKYCGNTGANGQLKLSFDTLAPGKYKVVVSTGDAKNYKAKKVVSTITVKKSPTKLTPTKLASKKGVKNFFKVKAINTKTKKPIVGLKLKVKVYTGKSSKIYTIKTKDKGIAYLNVKSLSVGKHRVVVASGEKYCVAKAVKSAIAITKK